METFFAVRLLRGGATMYHGYAGGWVLDVSNATRFVSKKEAADFATLYDRALVVKVSISVEVA